jgi:peptidyl-prolyl cis-trans isomerase B (cyclophilin B)
MRRALPFLAVLPAAVALAGCGGGGGSTTTTTTTSTTTTTAAASGGCTTVSMPTLSARKESKPTSQLDPSKTYTVTMKTNCGSFSFLIDQKESPNASASFVSLVDHGYFDKTIFHRIVPGFVIQGGDPTGSGTGGPGYTTVDTPPRTATYTLGTVAMAKTQTQPAGAAGSQFFIVTVANAGLPPQYAIIGKVTNGIAVVKRIGKLGNAQQEPTEIVEIEQASVKVS